VTTGSLARAAAGPRRFLRSALAREVGLFIALMAVYEFVRDRVEPASAAVPMEHAQQIVDAERALGLFVEPDVQRAVNGFPGGEFVTSWIYTLTYTAGFVAFFLWVWFRHRERFPFVRTWFWIVHGIAVIGFWLYPLAPPRLAGLGLADPTARTLELGGSLSWFEPFRNLYAAMPSMHVGQPVLFALAICWLARPSPWRFAAWAWPAVMLIVVMATANHYWLDAVGGAAAVLLGLGLATLFLRSQRKPWQAR
jgi:PAP2 superfamily protein